MKHHLIVAVASLVAGCATTPAPAPADAHFARLSSLCGKAFAGRISSPPVAEDRDFSGKALVMHVRQCTTDTIRIPFHVGTDRSRTWVVTRTAAGLRLKHDHRHADGSEDRLTQYGGDTLLPGSAARQTFPVDRSTRDLFVREARPQSLANIWAIEVEPGKFFAYELRRANRFFRVEFDLTTPIAPPPPPWGATD